MDASLKVYYLLQDVSFLYLGTSSDILIGKYNNKIERIKKQINKLSIK